MNYIHTVFYFSHQDLNFVEWLQEEQEALQLLFRERGSNCFGKSINVRNIVEVNTTISILKIQAFLISTCNFFILMAATSLIVFYKIYFKYLKFALT